MKILLLTMLVTALLLGEASATNVEDSLTIGIQSTKTTVLRPLDPQERDMVSIYDIMYDGLVTIDDNYVPQPCLAESWQESGSGKTWTFTLRSGVTFSDGTVLTAADVVASAQSILNRANATDTTDKGFYQTLAYFVSSISAQGDDTVVVKTPSGRRYWGVLYAMTFPVLPADQLQTDNPAGTGAYIITDFSPGNYLTMIANPNWWQTQPQVQTIQVVMFSTAKEVLEAYEYAQVDMVFTRSLSASQYKSGTSSLNITSRTCQLEVLAMNESSYPLNDVNVRRAIRYAIDVDKLASTNYNSMVTRTDLPTIPGTWLYNDNLTGWFTTDTNAAVALLEESGWTDTDGDGVRDMPKEDGSGVYRLHLRIFVYEEPDNSVRVETANSISDMLAAIGIECEVTTMTMSDIATRLKAGSFDLALVSYAMDTCPDPGFMLTKSNTGNYSRYNNADMNSLVNEKLRTALNQTDYQSAMYEIEELFAQECPYICLYYRDGSVLTRKMYTTARDIREYELLRGIDTFHP